MSRAGKPTDNPVNESLNGWIKEELFIDFHLAASNDVKQTLRDYISYYNNRRPSYSLGYVTPNHFYRMFINGEIPHKDSFSARELSEVPKFVRKRMEESAARLKEEQRSAINWSRRDELENGIKSIEDVMDVFNDATNPRRNK